MKKKKCALGLVALLAATAGLASCDWPTKTNNGIILTYTDATGARVGYTAEELFGTYRQSSGSLSTEFDKVYEVLVRKYYDEVKTSTKADLETEAKQKVLSDKQKATTNANNNGTTFEEELEKILNNSGVDNVDELYQHHLYDLEKEKFQSDMYQTFGTQSTSVNGVEAMKDGKYTDPATNEEKVTFPKSDDWGIGNDGWLLEQLPYHIRHVLVKLSSGQAGNFTQDKISESSSVDAGGETTKLANVMLSLAGGYVQDDGIIASKGDNRSTFGQVAQQYSDDGSAATYGEYGIMSKAMAADLVHEFKLGSYVFDTLYNKRITATEYGKANAYRLAPGLKAGEASDDLGSIKDPNQKLNTIEGEKTVYDFFNDKGVGQIPFGAAVALLDYAKVTTDEKGNVVNENNDAFYPRNIVYNKYFNKHNVCVVTPNAIASNYNSTHCDAATKAAAAGALASIESSFANEKASENGVPSAQFAALPGFSRDTSSVLPGISSNVLTDTQGNIILAVRAGASSYQGIHFIVVQRSGLSQYGLKEVSGQIVEATEQDAADKKSTSLSSYYTTYTPNQDKYPKTSANEERSTYVNYNVQQTSDFNDRANKIADEIKGFNNNLNTYWFQYLVDSQNIQFTETAADIKTDIMTYCQTKRDSSLAANVTTWEDNWKEYAEQIAAQDEARSIGAATGTGSLLSEVCAVGYGKVNKSTDPNWQKGGACYYATK